MRSILFGLASLLAAATTAHADPISVAHATDVTNPTSYIQGAIKAGGNDGYLTLGGSAEVGKLVAPHIWVHGSVTDGAAGDLFVIDDGSIVQVRAGADAMTCNGDGALCAYVGADAGYQRMQLAGHADSYSSSDTMTGAHGSDRLIGVARAGLDIGGTHLRWRPGVEVAFAGDGVNGVNLMQAIAYRF